MCLAVQVIPDENISMFRLSPMDISLLKSLMNIQCKVGFFIYVFMTDEYIFV
jgi:hypothetical protein